MFSGLPVQIHDSPDFSLVLPNAIYAVDGVFGLNHLPPAFLEALASSGPCGLLHEGDEFFRGPYSVYANFDFVIRSFPTPFLRSKGVLNMPCGYCNGVAPSEVLNASARPYLWSFTGQANASRRQMTAVLGGVTPSFCHIVDAAKGERHIGRDRFLSLLSDSAFTPCPMGNVQLETARLYEALEYGSIPLASRRAGLEYFERLFGPEHRIPVFRKWQDARVFMESMLENPARLDALQREVMEWWAAAKKRQIEDLRTFVNRGLTISYRHELQRQFTGMTDLSIQPARFMDILAMHDAAALAGRVGRVVDRYRRGVPRVTQRPPI